MDKNKTVNFNEKVRVHNMVTWKFAYNKARQKYWEYHAIDRVRFRRRIDQFEDVYRKIIYEK